MFMPSLPFALSCLDPEVQNGVLWKSQEYSLFANVYKGLFKLESTIKNHNELQVIWSF